MSKIFQKAALALGVVAIVAGGTTIAVASQGGTTTLGADNASQTQYNTGGQGCTPGYWKNSSAGWVTYSPTDKFDEVFGITKPPKAWPTSMTLQQALELGGGGFNALARHAAAALLNSANSNVNFAYSTNEVIELVKEAVNSNEPETAKNLLAEQNETTCSIDAHGNPIPQK